METREKEDVKETSHNHTQKAHDKADRCGEEDEEFKADYAKENIHISSEDNRVKATENGSSENGVKQGVEQGARKANDEDEEEDVGVVGELSEQALLEKMKERVKENKQSIHPFDVLFSNVEVSFQFII